MPRQQFRSGASGPAPDPSALNRNRPNDAASWTRLPARGLKEAPEWPIEAIDEDIPLTVREIAYWNRIWTEYPQAHIWKRQRMEMHVAAYVRTALTCASTNAQASLLTTFRQMGQELLIAPLALRAARCVIDEKIEEPLDEHGGQFGIAPVISIDGGTIRDRLKGQAVISRSSDDLDEDDENDGFDGDYVGDDE
jgi:hypothetical protein